MADESIINTRDAFKLASQQRVDIVNIGLMRMAELPRPENFII
jgi:hypothetical protein